MFVMTLLAALPGLAAPSAAADPPEPARFFTAAPAPREGCPDLRPRIADRAAPLRPGIGDPTETVRPRTLDELPPGRLELTVLRQVDGCPIPAVLRERIGAAAEDQRRR